MMQSIMKRPLQVYVDDEDLAALESWVRARGWTKSDAASHVEIPSAVDCRSNVRANRRVSSFSAVTLTHATGSALVNAVR